MAAPLDPERRLRDKALRCLAQREHSRSELGRKLLAEARRMAADAAAASGVAEPEAVELPAPAWAERIDRLLDRLQGQGLLDDRRFAESRVHHRQAGWGLKRLQGELDRHQVQLDPGSRQQLAATERDRAQALWARKFGVAPADLKQAQRQMRFLLARGFGGDVVRRVVPAVTPGSPGSPGTDGDRAQRQLGRQDPGETD